MLMPLPLLPYFRSLVIPIITELPVPGKMQFEAMDRQDQYNVPRGPHHDVCFGQRIRVVRNFMAFMSNTKTSNSVTAAPPLSPRALESWPSRVTGGNGSRAVMMINCSVAF
jgi:hypothetical protein